MDREDMQVDKATKKQVMTLSERRHQMTLEALQEADDGLFIDHSEIIAWVDSLKP